MSFYSEPCRLIDPVGNNALSYAERIALGSEGKLWIPPLVSGTMDNLSVSENIVFEELEDGKLISCKGLASLLMIEHHGKTIYITDNHNHALYFRYKALHDGCISPGATLLHIDQHADASEPLSYHDDSSMTSDELSKVAQYVNTQTQIASFIQPALHSGLLKECIQIRSEAKLQEITNEMRHTPHTPGTMAYILDIDMDFFAHERDASAKMALIRQLFPYVSLITIATSPYFMDQHRAIELIKILLDNVDK